MKTNQSGGSFNIPKDLLKEVNRVKEKAEKSPTDIEDVVSEVEKEKEEGKEEGIPEKEPSQEEKAEQLLKNIEADLKINIDEEDMFKALLNCDLIKRNIAIYPGKIHATFKYGITVEELHEINKHMGIAQKSETMTEVGLQSLNARHLLSHALLELGKPDNIKSIGNDPDERFLVIGNMNSLLMERLSQKWNMFVFLIEQKLKKDDAIKK